MTGITCDFMPVAVLPNISISENIETNFSALVPVHDIRVRNLCSAHPTFNKFLSKFTDVFGRKIAPSVFLFKPTIEHPRPTFDAVASFRDMAYICTIPCNQASLIEHENPHRPLWSDYFNFHPWMLDRDYEYLIGNSPAFTGLDKLDGFRGQSSPNLFAMSSGVTDKPLLNALTRKWEDHYFVNHQDKAEARLFRSLNMAFRAGEMPSGMQVNAYDAGRLIALWVSAFEILAHPEKGSVSSRVVRELISKTEWLYKAAAEPVFEKTYGNGANVKLNISAWMLEELYRLRNDFMHGNIIDDKALNIEGSGRSFFNFPPLLYRLAIAAKIDLLKSMPAISGQDASVLGEHISNMIDFNHPQRQIESALLFAMKPPRRKN